MTYKILYKPKGKAGEYCNGYALNLYDGCEHGCTYCYAPLVRKKSKDVFFKDVKPYKDVLDKLRKDLDKMVQDDDIQVVFMSFTSDPLQPCENTFHLTEQAIRMMELRGIPYRILTKAGYRQFERIASYITPERCTVGSTLVFMNDGDAKLIEKNAPPTSERIELLKAAKFMGCKTWVSLEPVYYPGHTFAIIHETCEFVDEYKIGKLNYHPQSKNVDWVKFAREISEFCDGFGVNYVLKEDLRMLLGVPA